MTTNVRRSIWPEPCAPTAHAAYQRAASWNPYYYRFFGADHSKLRPDLRPLTGDESCKALSRVASASGGTHPHRRPLARHLRRTLVSGYRPSSRDYESQFTALAANALARQIPRFEDARMAVLGDADTHLASPQGMSKPPEITFGDNAWTIKTEFLVRAPVGDAIELINPVHWQYIAPFFKETRRVEPKEPIRDPRAPWRGILYEKVFFNWNLLATESFDVFLNIDFTVIPKAKQSSPDSSTDLQEARADYSLRYEKNNKILIDDGYVKVSAEPSGLTRYIGYKRVRFASSFANCIVPGLMCMLLEQDEDWFREIFESEVQLVAAPDMITPAARRPKDNRQKGRVRNAKRR